MPNVGAILANFVASLRWLLRSEYELDYFWICSSPVALLI